MTSKWELSARSRTGDPVNQITGADHDAVTVYSRTDLNQRVEAAKTDPRNLDVTVRPLD
ncbi:hypothetical protein ACGF3G_00495 [Streptomyces sp. NPDC048179]|uniref:hypothetical protein n=1 Tax=Streptomyces sp. NPDC048179 TaxID=3365506 RepID=UPI00371A294C